MRSPGSSCRSTAFVRAHGSAHLPGSGSAPDQCALVARALAHVAPAGPRESPTVFEHVLFGRDVTDAVTKRVPGDPPY